ncbi:hypothetical protein J6590_063159 [Homalodisca vitripennis]|nr:hypothetical protein J6590_063159 [Homalodisca vitripennis]
MKDIPMRLCIRWMEKCEAILQGLILITSPEPSTPPHQTANPSVLSQAALQM